MIYRINAIKGVQAGLPYYTCMISIWQLIAFLDMTNAKLPAEKRAQRQLNKSRIPDIKKYILDNSDSYVFSAVTLCVDGNLVFDEFDSCATPKCGVLCISDESKVAIIDGQHRISALRDAMAENKKLRYEHLPVVLFRDFGLERSQQMFSDLNRHVIRPTKSLNVMYDKRDPMARIVCKLFRELPVFRKTVEPEKASVPVRSDNLFTVSAIYNATSELLHGMPLSSNNDAFDVAKAFWNKLYEIIPEWSCVQNGTEEAGEVRKKTVCTQAVTLIALGRTGCFCYSKRHDFEDLSALTNVNWMRDNPQWQGMLVNDNKVSGTRASTQALTKHLISLISR
ncbi:DNA sulfur modification protein DndB [Clostridiales bacterium FE2011]|nr:DNA sulfur modification protein DndB [Clostridiales bacterium FE2011]